MPRYDKEDVSDLNLPDETTVKTTFFTHGGQEKQNSENCFAKEVVIHSDYNNISEKYYVLVGRGELLDPYQVDSSYNKSKINNMYKFKKVSEKTFKSYLKYLQTKNRLYFTMARRMIME
jgi:hypothetical protein